MSSAPFIRPEVRAAIRRWRELLSGAGVAGLGLFLVLGPGGMLGWVGWGLIAAGLALTVIGVQRARFRAGTGGPGVVQVDEGQIAYFGPLTGGTMATAELSRLIYEPGAKPAHWVLERSGQPALCIPVTAQGAEALFDVFSALPGLRTETMLAALSDPPAGPVVIWQRRSAQLSDQQSQ